MLMYLYGPDAYRRGKKLQDIVSAYTAKHPAATYEVFFMEEKGSLERLRAFLGNQSLFASVRLAVIYRPDEADGSAKILKEFLEDKSMTLIVVSEKKLPKEFAFLLKKPSLAQEFEALSEAELYSFIKKEAAGEGAEISPEMLRILSETFGPDTWSIVTELRKIALGGSLEAPMSAPAFFPLVQSLKKRGDVRARIRALGYLLLNEDAAAVFNITASLADSDMKIQMADFDIAVKSGKLEYEEALLALALS